jgi:hypothetical protein
LVGGLAAEQLVAPGQEVAVAAVGLEEPARVDGAQLEHPRGDVLEEVAVVAHHQAGARLFGENLLQPQDAVDVEVVGGLVQQEHVGGGCQLARDGEALLPAAGQRIDRRASVREAGAAQRPGEAAGPLGLVDALERGGEHGLDGKAGREDGVLRHVAEHDAAAERARAAVGRLEAGEDPQQRGLARAVGPD